MNERIKEIIMEIGIRKSEFARRLNISAAFASELCSGAKSPSDRTVADICREFRVDEAWLRTGEGEMFKKIPRDQEIAEFMDGLLRGDAEFKRNLVAVLARLDESQWAALERVAWGLVEEMKTEAATQARQVDPPELERKNQELVSRLESLEGETNEEYAERMKQEILREKKAEGGSEAWTGTGGRSRMA